MTWTITRLVAVAVIGLALTAEIRRGASGNLYGVTATAIPEPSVLVLFGLGLSAALLRRRTPGGNLARRHRLPCSLSATTVFLALLAATGFTHAAVVTNLGATPPVFDADDIGAFTSEDELSSFGNDSYTNKKIGQTFRTGGNPAGYEWTSVAFQVAPWAFNLTDATLEVYVGTYAANTNTFTQTSVFSGTFSTNSAGDHIEMVFDSPVALAASADYGFWLNTPSTWLGVAGATDGSGNLVSTVANGAAARFLDPVVEDEDGYDLEFRAGINAIPEPSSFLLTGLGVALLLARRRAGLRRKATRACD